MRHRTVQTHQMSTTVEKVRSEVAALAAQVERGERQYLADRKLAATQLAMAMTDAIGGNKYRQAFLLTIFGKVKTTELSDEEFAGLWHWCKPYVEEATHHWHINVNAYMALLLVMREVMLGAWVDADGDAVATY